MNDIYNDFPINNPIWNVSNPQTVRDNYNRLYDNFKHQIKLQTGYDSEIYLSSRKNKKYMVFNGINMTHFGDIRYEDFTKHLDDERRHRYLKRFHKCNSLPYSAYQLSLFLLW